MVINIRKKKIILLFLFLVFLSIIAIIPFSLTSTDIEFTFQEKTLYKTSDIQYNRTFNIRNISQYTNDYNGTYSFENEIGLEGTNISFVDSENFISSNGDLTIIENYNNHSSVLHAFPYTNNVYFEHNFENRTFGVLEFWYLTNATGTTKKILLEEMGSDYFLELILNTTGEIYYNRSGIGLTKITDYYANDWIHFSIAFDVDSELFDIRINGIEYLNLNASYNPAYDYQVVNNIRFQSYNDNTDHSCLWYIDAFSYAWTPNFFGFEEFYDGEYFRTDFYPYNTWNYNNQSGTYAGILDFSPIYRQYLHIDDNHPTNRIFLTQYFGENRQNGTIELYFRSEDNDDNFNIQLRGNVIIVDIGLGTGGYLHILTEATSYFPVTLNDYTWYKLNIYFNCTSDIISIWLDDTYIDTYSITNLADYVSQIQFYSTTQSYQSYLHIDSLQYNWGYNLGDNIVPYEEILEIKEVNKDEFDLEDFDDFYDLGEDNPEGYTESDPNDRINIAYFDGDTYKRSVEIQGLGSDATGPHYLEKNISLENETRFEIKTTIRVLEWDNHDNARFWIKVFSFDDTEIVHVRILQEGILQYYNGTDHNNLTTGLSLDTIYDLEIYFDTNDNMVNILLFEEDIHINTFYFDLIDYDKEGIGKFQFGVTSYNTGAGNDYKIEVDSIGVFVNGESFSNAYGYDSIDIYSGLWYKNEYNLIEMISYGNFSLFIHGLQPYLPETLLLDPFFIDLYIEGDRTVNIYDWNYLYYTDFVSNPFLVLYLRNNNNYTLDYLNIEGVSLIRGSYEYNLEFSHSNVNINESYFYGTNNRLEYYFYATNTSELEYIQAEFDINNFLTENYSIQFDSNKIGTCFGEIRLSYTDATSSIYEIPDHRTRSSEILPQEKTLDEIYITISDNNITSSYSTGYVRDIRFRYVPGIELTITIITLVSVLIPIIVIIAPTLAIYTKLGKDSIIPMLVLMSLLCFATGLIPAWIFFIIVLSLAVFLFMRKRGVTFSE